MELSLDFKEFFESLNKSDVRYLVVGGYAVSFHGHPRYTKDIDVWIDATPENVARLIQSLHFNDLDHLKQNKRAVGRLQDLADLDNLV